MFLAASLAAGAARAEEFSMTDAQFLYGNGYRDPFIDTNADNGRVSTVSLEHYGTWGYGDNYFLFNIYQGDFDGIATKIFCKWISRLSLAKMLGEKDGSRCRCSRIS